MNAERPMTKGERRVRLAFNPSDNSIVARIKRAAADLIDLCDEIPQTEGEEKRLVALAQTDIEDAAMWTVKAATA